MAEIKQKWPWPRNVGVLGTFPEEVKETQRRVEKNIDASPMPELAPTKLLSPSRNSENLRMGEPAVDVEMLADNYQYTLTHVVVRRLLAKARARGAVLFDEAIEEAPLRGMPADRREQMRTMVSRERAMMEILDRYNTLAEDVYMRLLASSKG